MEREERRGMGGDYIKCLVRENVSQSFVCVYMWVLWCYIYHVVSFIQKLYMLYCINLRSSPPVCVCAHPPSL